MPLVVSLAASEELVVLSDDDAELVVGELELVVDGVVGLKNLVSVIEAAMPAARIIAIMSRARLIDETARPVGNMQVL